MNVLVLGEGGREHAFAYKIAKSSLCNNLFIAPGNAGTSEVGVNVALNPLDFKSIRMFVLKDNINLILVGPETPLVKGIYDFFKNWLLLHTLNNLFRILSESEVEQYRELGISEIQ